MGRRYFLDKNTETIKFADEESELIQQTAYKGYTWKTLKQANKFKEKIYKTHLDDLGLRKDINLIWNMPRIENEIERKLELIQEKNNYLKSVYPGGFEKSKEWRKRLELEQEWKFLTCSLSFLRLQAQEVIQREVFNSGQNVKGIGANEVTNCIEKGIYRSHFDTLAIREVSEQYREDKERIEREIEQKIKAYKMLHEEYKLDDDFLDKQKDYLINYLGRLRRLRKLQRQNQINIYSYMNNFAGGRIEIKKLRDLAFDDVKFNLELDRLNLYVKRKDTVRNIRFVNQMNERLACIDFKWNLLTNEDTIIIDKEFIGEHLDYLDNSLSFYNENEVNYRRWEENSPRAIDEIIGRRIVKNEV